MWSGTTLFVAPHPDDEMFVANCIRNSKNAHVVYCTSGENGLPSTYPKGTRQTEAKSAMDRLTGGQARTTFMNLPFYEERREPNQLDVQLVCELLRALQPKRVFLCGDDDPNGTHLKCLKLWSEALLKFDTALYLYVGAWKPHAWWRGTLVMACSDPQKHAWEAYESQMKLLVNTDDARALPERYKDLIEKHGGEHLMLTDNHELAKILSV